jgi:diguanylate cyclase (GGDEF)-like protein/PAS domain S-box-containing protein
MYWLIMLSNSIAELACLMALAAVFAALWRQDVCSLIWQARLLPIVVLAAVALAALSTRVTALPHIAMVLTARLLFLAAVGLLWPILRQFAAQERPAQTPARCELARAEATDSRHWLHLAEKIAKVCHWRYTVPDNALTWSAQVYEMFGLSPDSYKPDLDVVFQLIAPDDRARAVAGFEKALKHAAPFEVTVKVPMPQGHYGHVTARGVPELGDAGEVVAVFGVFVDITAQKRIEEELQNAHRMSEAANKALEALALHDSLTGLPNRRNFDATIATEFRRAAREGQTVGLIMIGVDFFKSYHDAYGSAAGDECLRLVADAIASVPQRPGDMVARYGGEEIAVLLANTGLAGTVTVAEMILHAVRALQVAHDGNSEGIVTVSCGAAAFDPQRDPIVPVQLIERADQALCKAKREGRNRAACLEEEESSAF